MVILPGMAANTTVPTLLTSADTGLNITKLQVMNLFLMFYVVILDVMGPPNVNIYSALSQYILICLNRFAVQTTSIRPESIHIR